MVEQGSNQPLSSQPESGMTDREIEARASRLLSESFHRQLGPGESYVTQFKRLVGCPQDMELDEWRRTRDAADENR